MKEIMNDFHRDPTTGALIFSDSRKREEILEKRRILRELRDLRQELNNLKKTLEHLESKSN